MTERQNVILKKLLSNPETGMFKCNYSY